MTGPWEKDSPSINSLARSAADGCRNCDSSDQERDPLGTESPKRFWPNSARLRRPRTGAFAYQEEMRVARKGNHRCMTVSQPVDGKLERGNRLCPASFERCRDSFAKTCGCDLRNEDMMQQTREQLSIRFPGIEVLTNY